MDTIAGEITNNQKHENYREQFNRLNKSLANGFNLEAMFIEYAIIEDRTESVLRHAGLWDAYLKKRKGREPSLDSKIKYIYSHAQNGIAGLKKRFSDDLLPEILAWKEERNRLIHALLKQKLEQDEIRSIAERGNELVKTLRCRSSQYNRDVAKLDIKAVIK